MLEKGDIINIEVIDLSHEAKPIGRQDGLVVFGSKGTYGDVIKVEVTKVKKNYTLGRTLEIVAESPYRTKAPCSHFENCGGCTYMNLDYDAQLKLKREQLINKLKRLGDIDQPNVKDFPKVEDDDLFAYRNKTTYEITTHGNIKRKGGIIENLGPITIGFKERGSNKIIDVEDCKIQSLAAKAALKATKEFMISDNITAYDSKWDQGLMKNMVVRVSEDTGEVMVNYILNGKAIPNGEKLISMLDDAIYESGYDLVSVNLSEKKSKDKSQDVYGEKINEYAGRGIIKDKIGDFDFEVSPRSFYQVNRKMTKLLYDKVLEYCNLTGTENILDLYCGVGSIGIYCANHAKAVLGIEVVKEAVINANRNAVINNHVNIRFLQGKAEDVVLSLKNGNGDSALVDIAKNVDVVILDPPRAGCHETLLDSVAQLEPKRIVYVSCDPATLARDIGKLKSLGYDFVEATPFDMFAFSSHVECIALIQRVK